jgi:hypothetical protein
MTSDSAKKEEEAANGFCNLIAASQKKKRKKRKVANSIFQPVKRKKILLRIEWCSMKKIFKKNITKNSKFQKSDLVKFKNFLKVLDLLSTLKSSIIGEFHDKFFSSPYST